MRSALKKIRKMLYRILGVRLNKQKNGNRSNSMPDWKERLYHAKRLGFCPKVIFDCGAFQGIWSMNVINIFPQSQLVLIEPNPFIQGIIKDNVSKIQPPVILIDKALGQISGETSFNIWGDVTTAGGASLLEHISGKADTVVNVKVETLDNISEELRLIPDLMKLDLQGGELLALRGGIKTLERAEMVIVEFGCLEAYINRATPRDIIDVMYDNDYCLYDIVNCNYRPYDGAMNGGDFFFVKNRSVLRKYKGWE